MSRKLRKFIFIMLIICILSVIYLVYINSDEYKKSHRVEVVNNMQIYVNDKYICDTRLGNYSWNQGKTEEGFEDIKDENSVNIYDIEYEKLNLKSGDIIKFKLPKEYLNNKYNIKSASLEIYLNGKLFATYKTRVEKSEIIFSENIKQGEYKCILDISFENRGQINQIFEIVI